MVLSMKKLYASQEKNKNKISELKFLHISVPHLSVKQRGYFLRKRSKVYASTSRTLFRIFAANSGFQGSG